MQTCDAVNATCIYKDDFDDRVTEMVSVQITNFPIYGKNGGFHICRVVGISKIETTNASKVNFIKNSNKKMDKSVTHYKVRNLLYVRKIIAN